MLWRRRESRRGVGSESFARGASKILLMYVAGNTAESQAGTPTIKHTAFQEQVAAITGSRV